MLGLAGDIFFVGDTESCRIGEAETSLESFGFGRGGRVSAEVAGRELELSLPLRRLSGRPKGSSRRGGISCSSVSGIAVVVELEGRPVCGRGSAGSDDSRAASSGSRVPDDKGPFVCAGSTLHEGKSSVVAGRASGLGGNSCITSTLGLFDVDENLSTKGPEGWYVTSLGLFCDANVGVVHDR